MTDDIFQVIDGEAYHCGFRQTSICCGCNLVHHERYSIRKNRKTGKRELWCVAVRDLNMTRKLRRKAKRKGA